MGKLNRIPQGFLDLVQAQTGGQLPSEYSETVSPTLDFSLFYFGQRKDNESESSTFTIAGDSHNDDVPNDEVWLLTSIRGFATALAAGEFIWTDVIVQRLAGAAAATELFPIHSFKFDSPAGGGNASDTFMLPRPLLLAPGERVNHVVRATNVAVGRVFQTDLGIVRATV